MITLPEVEKLGRIHAVEPVVLSLYLNVPRSAAQLPRLPDRVDELVAAERNTGRSGHLREEDWRSAREEAALAAPDWPGHPLAIFACAEVGLLEVIVLPEARPGMASERAVLGVRPHIRPLLAVLQSSPRLTAEILAEPGGGLTTVGLPGLPGCGQCPCGGDPGGSVRRADTGLRMRTVRRAGPDRRVLPRLGDRAAARARPHRGDGQPDARRRRSGRRGSRCTGRVRRQDAQLTERIPGAHVTKVLKAGTSGANAIRLPEGCLAC